MTTPSPACGPLVIGLVNNMPPAAVHSTERQFSSLIAAASGPVTVELRLFSLAVDGTQGQLGGYGDVASLAESRLDGLIVTGTPPAAASLRDEPSWPSLIRLIGLARARGLPTVWSCLAAHAAVLHLDGVERHLLPRKLSGLVASENAAPNHPLMADIPQSWATPHSRYNGLPSPALMAHGYQILSRSQEGGADIFLKDVGVPFLFFQGHPEYEPDTLLREYRRDVGEFVSGLRETYPDLPTSYFDPPAIARLDEFRARAIRERRTELMASFPMGACQERLEAPWRDVAIRVYRNWLAQLHAKRVGGHRRHEADDRGPDDRWRRLTTRQRA